MKKIHFTMICVFVFSGLGALSLQDLDFLIDRANHATLIRYAPQAEAMLSSTQTDETTLHKLLDYFRRAGLSNSEARCLYRLAVRHQDLDAAIDWIKLSKPRNNMLRLLMQKEIDLRFNSPADKLSLLFAKGLISDSLFYAGIRDLPVYNEDIESHARQSVEAFAVERSDTLALKMIDGFLTDFPNSRYGHYAFHYKLYHLLNLGLYDDMERLIRENARLSPEHAAVAAQFLLNPSLLQSRGSSSLQYIAQARDLLTFAENSIADAEMREVLFVRYNQESWRARLRLNRLKAGYHELRLRASEHHNQRYHFPPPELTPLLALADSISFINNDNGEQAELSFWKARLFSLVSVAPYQETAARHYLACLISGSPRKRYDADALKALEAIHAELKIKPSLTDWSRSVANYKGIVFTDSGTAMGLGDNRFTRVAIGDYDSDGWLDLLFNGSRLYRNQAGQRFIDLSDSLNLAGLAASGGLWADFNRDGWLDIASVSHASDGFGDALLKNQLGTRFVNVNERAGDIDDGYPSEAAAWIDAEGSGYPSLYVANYETWGERSGYPDSFWLNEAGYFTERGKELGFRTEADTDDPGRAGRGVAPADFNDDGRTDILVTNYRLNRNFLYVNTPDGFIDEAFSSGVAGKYKQGYYGHSIGADWGDYDNDGDLDLFIANLAHPRYIDISDISMLLRNDGPAEYAIGSETFTYQRFTDVTKEAGISWDELHSDPLWFDADNDGWLDLFITSVYENDRSYLYKNNGDGSFTDITWLSGARVYNGWGNACGDLNRDGLPDLVVGSGNGTKILINNTATQNQALYVKPIWKGGQVLLIDQPDSYPSYPNSPAFGTRVKVTLQNEDGSMRTLIRELNSAKGTNSQNAPELHFGIGKAKPVAIERMLYGQDKN